MRVGLILLCLSGFSFWAFTKGTVDIFAQPDFQLKGKVKSFYETTSSNDYRNQADTLLVRFNKNGNITTRQINRPGESPLFISNSYGRAGNRIAGKSERDGVVISWDSLTYDRNGNLIEHRFFETQTLFGQTRKYAYNERGALIEQFTLSSIGKILERQKFEYNQVGQKIGEVFYYREKDSARYKFWYDEKGNFIKKTRDDAVYETYQYNEMNQVVLKISYKHFRYETNIYKQYNSYDTNGNLIETIDSSFMNTEGNSSITTISYDENGNIILKGLIKTYSDGNKELITTYTYKYDKQKNWVKRTENTSDGKWVVTERVIEYY